MSLAAPPPRDVFVTLGCQMDDGVNVPEGLCPGRLPTGNIGTKEIASRSWRATDQREAVLTKFVQVLRQVGGQIASCARQNNPSHLVTRPQSDQGLLSYAKFLRHWPFPGNSSLPRCKSTSALKIQGLCVIGSFKVRAHAGRGMYSPTDGGRRFTGYIVSDAGNALDLVDDPA